MTDYMSYIKEIFPSMDEELCNYVEGILESSVDDFNCSDQIFEAIGEFLLQSDDTKSETDIKSICETLSKMKPISENGVSNGNRVLDCPIHLGSVMAELDNASSRNNKSMWTVQKNNSLTEVDTKKLTKAKDKQKQKQTKKENGRTDPVGSNATASQVTSKKEAKLEAKGVNKLQDIRLENFDISFGEKILLQNSNLTLAFGRRYGLVGRNGLGKTTLLRLLSSRQLRIPSHISILHVEQEVVGDETPALESVLLSDTNRSKLLDREKELTALLSNNNGQDTALNLELNEIYSALESIEADKAPARASVILAGLGFSPQMQKQTTKEFSGGWRMRLALARALFSRPDLLLLDEPTNMLDMKAIIWLENYLQNWPTTLLVVSHDRHFLDVVPTDILNFHSQRIDAYRGNYDLFEKTKTEKLKNQQREIDAQIAQKSHIQEFIDRFRYNANRASSVQSKIKMLEKMPELKPIEKEQEIVLKFPETDKISPPIIQLDEVSFRYPNAKDSVLINVNLTANLESRICIVGDNGAGKTTLLKLIMGVLDPTSGSVYVNRNVRFGYFSQHHVDQLEMNVSSVELLMSTLPGKPAEEYRRHLGSFGVTGDLALQPVDSLSGGQKSRVAFARMCLSLPNFLILDEPTNHLDISTIEALAKAVNKYTGGVILVSHDERFIRRVCRELWVCGNRTVRCVDGGFNEYRKIVEKELNEAAAK